jgi:hypothetical protein
MANALLFRPLRWASITASVTATNYSADNLLPWPVPRMGRVWRKTSGASNASLTIDLGSDHEVDTIAAFGIGNGDAPPVGVSWNWQIDFATEAQGADFGAGDFWTSGSLSFAQTGTLPVSQRAKALWLAPSGAPSLVRYIRLRFTNMGGDATQIALIAVGKRFQPQRNYSFGAAFGVRDLGELDYSPRGVVLHRRAKKLRGMGLTFRALRKDEVEGQLQRLFEQVGNTDPVVLVSDPAADAQLQNRMGIGHLTGNLGSIHRVPGAYQAEINFVAVD